MNYSDKLKDPRWQRKRLEVFNHADFHCQLCGEGTKTLHVHHSRYDGREPWDYPLGMLICLCEDCHDQHHKEANPSLNQHGMFSKNGEEWVSLHYRKDETAPPVTFFVPLPALMELRAEAKGDLLADPLITSVCNHLAQRKQLEPPKAFSSIEAIYAAEHLAPDTAIAWGRVASSYESSIKFRWLTKAIFAEANNDKVIVRIPSFLEGELRSVVGEAGRKNAEAKLCEAMGKKMDLVFELLPS